jgi:hypothetical protein
MELKRTDITGLLCWGATRRQFADGSVGLAGAYARKVDIGLQRYVDRVGEEVESDIGDDFDEFRVRVTRHA